MASEADNGEFSNASTEFLSWLIGNGATISPKIQLADLRSRQAGRGVLAVADIDDDEELFSIPRSSILTVATSSLPESLKENLPNGGEDPWLSLILAMIFEFQQRGEASKWRQYFNVLPADFDTLMYWSQTQLEALAGSAVVEKIGKASADKAFKEHILPLVRAHSASFNADDLSDEDVLTLCHRMGSTIMAYAFDLEPSTSTSDSHNSNDHNQDQPNSAQQEEWELASDAEGLDLPKGLIPLADILNADGPERNNAKLFYAPSAVTMRALRPIAVGEELLNDYGPLPRADLLRRYGYVSMQYASYDVVEIGMDLIREVALAHEQSTTSSKAKSEVEARLEERLVYLEEAGLADDGYDIGLTSKSNNGEATSQGEDFSEELKSLLNGLTMTEEEFAKLKSKDKIPKPEPLSLKACELLYAVLVQRGAMYPETPQQTLLVPDIETRDSRRRHMATQVIEGERRVLRGAAEALTALMTSSTGTSNGISKKRKAEEFDTEVTEARQSTTTHKEKRRR